MRSGVLQCSVSCPVALRQACKSTDICALVPGHDLHQADATRAYTKQRGFLFVFPVGAWVSRKFGEP
eukprot:8739029-Prorocentrum_lima.AAC.1